LPGREPKHRERKIGTWSSTRMMRDGRAEDSRFAWCDIGGNSRDSRENL
jgi:hypothetical protein